VLAAGNKASGPLGRAVEIDGNKNHDCYQPYRTKNTSDTSEVQARKELELAKDFGGLNELHLLFLEHQ
jgi:hypothetical protein